MLVVVVVFAEILLLSCCCCRVVCLLFICLLLLGEVKEGLRPSLQGEDEEGSMVACLYEAEGEGSWDGTGLPCRPDCSALPDATWDFITGNIRGLTGVVGLYREEYFF